MWDKRARVITNYDGDTVTVELDQGFWDTKRINLRLDAVYAPELSQPGGLETRDYVTAWLTERAGGDTWPFVVVTRMNRAATREIATFGRIVGTLTHGQDSLNAAVTEYVRANGYPPGA